MFGILFVLMDSFEDGTDVALSRLSRTGAKKERVEFPAFEKRRNIVVSAEYYASHTQTDVSRRKSRKGTHISQGERRSNTLLYKLRGQADKYTAAQDGKVLCIDSCTSINAL